MKKLYLIAALIVSTCLPFITMGQGHGVGSLGKKLLAKVVDNPELTNDAYTQFRSTLLNAAPGRYDFVRNLDLKFKTFKAGKQSATLGFEYKYDNSWTRSS